MYLIVYLRGTSLKHARTKQRNIVADHLRNSNKDAALVAFVASNPKNWCLSFVQVEYMQASKRNIYHKTKRKLPLAQRHSFVAGKEENYRTAQRRLVQLICERNFPDLRDVEKAFSVENVAEVFFEEYEALFFQLKDEMVRILEKNPRVHNHFQDKNIDTANFSKKLLWQVVVLHFLQKRGWLGVERGAKWGSGNRNFLLMLFMKAKEEQKSFFNDVLEPMFYEALNTDRRKENDYYSPLDSRIPFLNGGLFEPFGNYDWKGLRIPLPNELFFNTGKTTYDLEKIIQVLRYEFGLDSEKQIPGAEDVAMRLEALSDSKKTAPPMPARVTWWLWDELLSAEKKAEGGILDVFDRHNFTVNTDDDPLDREVAIGPGMIGKVSENLLENGNRESQGTYYKRHAVVRYMCQESLIDYLVTELEGNITEEEVSVWVKQDTHQLSGLTRGGFSFKEGILPMDSSQLLNRTRIHLILRRGSVPTDNSQFLARIRGVASSIDTKLKEVYVCDPAVGSGAFLAEMMNEIVRLRIKAKGLKGEPLNEQTVYKLRRHVIENCLYGVATDADATEIARLRMWLSLVVDEQKRETIEPLPNLDYKFIEGDILLDTQNLIEHDGEQFDKLLKRFFNETSRRKKQELRTEIDQTVAKIHGKEKTFDPRLFCSEPFRQKGGFDIVIGKPPCIQLQQEDGKLGEQYKNESPQKAKKMNDIHARFCKRAQGLLNGKGRACLIASQKWMYTRHRKKLGDYLITNTPLKPLDWGPDVFDATVGTNILMFSKQKREIVRQAGIHKKDKKYPDGMHTSALANKELARRAFIRPREAHIMKKIEDNAVRLIQWNVSLRRGITTGYDAAFIVDKPTKERLCREDKRSCKVLKPILRGEDIQRYHAQWKELWLIDTHNGYSDNTGTVDPISQSSKPRRHESHVDPIRIADYPAIKAHLDKHWEKIEKRPGKGDTPYNLQNCAYYPEFGKEKVVWSATSTYPTFSLLEGGCFLPDSAYMLTSKQKYLTPYASGRPLLTYEEVYKEVYEEVHRERRPRRKIREGDQEVTKEATAQAKYMLKVEQNKYFLAILNSSVVAFYLPRFASGFGEEGARCIKQFVGQLPIPLFTVKNCSIVREMMREVDKLIESRGSLEYEDMQKYIINTNACALYGIRHRQYLAPVKEAYDRGRYEKEH